VLLTENPPNELPPTIAAMPTRKRAVIVVGSIAALFAVAMLGMVLFGGWQSAEAVDRDAGNRKTPTETLANSAVLGESQANSTPTLEAGLPEDILLPIVGAAATETLLPSVTITEFPVMEAQPPTATKIPPTAVSTTCGAPNGWVIYVVKVGDTLSSIAQDQGISIVELQNANCLSTAAVYVGQRLYVPNTVNSTPDPTWTVTKAPAATIALTNTPVPSDTQKPTQEPTEQPTFAPTDTEVPPLPTDTALPAPSETPIPAPTNPPGPTATPTPISLPVTPTP